jgi:hypothetical protein
MLLLIGGAILTFVGLFVLWMVIWALTMSGPSELPVGVYPEASSRADDIEYLR